jgi:SAM-dependent methyltransferase
VIGEGRRAAGVSPEESGPARRDHPGAESLQAYYDRRAREYEQVYYRDDPLRQGELQAIAAAVRETFAGRRVLEVACGTGYWTAVLAATARHVVAIDASPEMLAIARAKGLPPEKVEFRAGDAYALEEVPGEFEAGLANFWLSHVPKARIDAFLLGFHKRLGSGATVFMADNSYLPGVGGELVVRPGIADTFKLRTLADGSQYEVLKNYYDADQLQRLLAPWASELQVHAGPCYWWVSYPVP